MTEEEFFRKNYPDYCYGDRLLSPYWDLFQDGVEFGERQSEQKIADLKETNAILSESSAINQKDIEYKVSVIKQRNKRIEELEKIIEQMQDAKCISCTDLGGMLLKITDLEKKNAKLKDALKGKRCNCMTYLNFKDLEKELTKAKEIIKELVRVEYADFTNGDYSNELSKVLEQAEQFLKADVGTKNYEEQNKILKTRLL